MKTDLIRVRAGPGGALETEACPPIAEPARFLAAARSAGGPVAYLLCNDEAPLFAGLDRLVVDRGRKNPSKPLSRLLLGYREVPLIRGSYTSAGQLLRSVRTLLAHARRLDEDNLYLIGVDADVFEELQIRIGGTDPPSRTAAGSEPTDVPETAGPGTSLADLLPKRPVPAAVRRRYVGESGMVELVRQLALRAARNDEPVLILGDTGTGKEVVARIIHDRGPRRKRTFVAVNCGAIPRELFESELFGAERGAYTDLRERKIGLWPAAHGGTLFLDEIADLALNHQVKILRALEDGAIRPLGSEKTLKIDARIIAATNRDLFSMVQTGEFRPDLYYRLRSFLIRTPAVREHPEDVPILARFFWRGITGDAEKTLPEPIVEELRSYRWPGNAREMKMVLSSLHALFGTDVRLEQLRAIFEFEGQMAAGPGGPRIQEAGFPRSETAPPEPPSLDEIGLHRVECLRHLRQVDEVLQAWQATVRPVLAARRLKPTRIPQALSSARRRARELEFLCVRPLLFGSKATFSALQGLAVALDAFHALLDRDPAAARATWEEQLEAEIGAAQSAVFEEVRQLLADG